MHGETRLRRLLEAAERLAGMGSWEWRPASGEMLWSQNMFRIVGLDPDSTDPTPELIFEFTHPADLGRHRREIQRLADGTEERSFDVRIVRPNGAVRRLRSTIAVFAENGEPRRMLACVHDLGANRVGLVAPTLTPRELEVLQRAADGGSGPMIAQELGISRATVKTHFNHIHEKLGVSDRASAVAVALRYGLFE
jgi:DNA-binding CsgD family transcriptional regulator